MGSKQEEIDRLLRAGLDHYGRGDAAAAVRDWNAVLAIDPRNSDARDYIDSVDAGGAAAEHAAEAAPFEAGEQTLLEEAVGLLGQAREVDAYALLESATAPGFGQELDLDTLAVLELVRARLLPIYRAGFRAEVVPRVAGDPAQLDALGLSEAALRLHAACDGKTAIESLPQASGLGAFDALHQLSVLVDAGLVSIFE